MFGVSAPFGDQNERNGVFLQPPAPAGSGDICSASCEPRDDFAVRPDTRCPHGSSSACCCCCRRGRQLVPNPPKTGARVTRSPFIHKYRRARHTNRREAKGKKSPPSCRNPQRLRGVFILDLESCWQPGCTHSSPWPRTSSIAVPGAGWSSGGSTGAARGRGCERPGRVCKPWGEGAERGPCARRGVKERKAEGLRR